MSEYKSELVRNLVDRGYHFQSTDLSALDERARRGIAVTQSDRLGDTAINASSATVSNNNLTNYGKDMSGVEALAAAIPECK